MSELIKVIQDTRGSWGIAGRPPNERHLCLRITERDRKLIEISLRIVNVLTLGLVR